MASRSALAEVRDMLDRLRTEASQTMGKFTEPAKQIMNNLPGIQPKMVSPVPSYSTKDTRTIPQKVAYNFWQSPVGQGLVGAQKWAQTSQPAQYQPFNQKTISGNIGNFAVGVPTAIANVPIKTGMDVGNIIGGTLTGQGIPSYQNLKSPLMRLAYNARGQAATPRQVAGNIAGIGEDVLTAYTPALLQNLGKQTINTAAKQTLLQATKQGAIQGGTTGGIFGLLSGLEQARGVQDKKYYSDVSKSMFTGMAVGTVAGGVLSGGANALGKLKERLIQRRIQGGVKRPQAEKDVSRWIKDTKGKFLGSKKQGKEPYWYGDMAEEVGLPRYSNFESGEINFGADVGGTTRGKANLNQMQQSTKQSQRLQAKGQPATLPNQKNLKKLSAQQPELGELQPGVKQMPSEEVGKQTPMQQQVSQSSWNNFTSNVKAKANRLYTEAIDRFHPLSKLAKEAGEDQSMRNALTGHYGAGSTANYHVDYELTPILKEQNIDDIRRVAIAARDSELSGRGIQGSNTGLTLEGLKKELGEQKFNSVQETLKKLYKYQDDIVQEYLVKTGIIGKESYQKMRANNQFYVPFKRVMDEMDDYLGMTPQTKGAGSVSGQDIVYRIKGSKKELIDPIESILESTYKSVGLGKRQQVAQAIVNLKDKLPEGLITKIKGTVGKQPNIALFENGKVQHYAVPPEIADSAKGLSEETMNSLVKILRAPTSVFRATATGINPEFAVPNVARDVQSAFVNAGLNPLKWVKGLAHMMKKDQVYQDFLKYGGRSTTRISIDRPMLTKTVAEISGNGKELAQLKPSNLLKLLQVFGEYSETPTRVAVFEKKFLDGVKKGLSNDEAAKQAAYWAQEATVNFARRGAKTQAINAIYAFLNARTQGLDRLVRSLKNDPARVGTRIGMVSLLPALGMYSWNRNFQSYYDDRVVTDTDKDNNFIFMLSDTPIPALGGAQFIKIPKGDIGKLANPVERFMSFSEGKGGDVKQGLLSALKGFSPMDNVGDLIPTALRPPVEQAANKNFFYDSSIVPEYKTDYPAKYQDTSTTAPLYRMIGQQLNVSPARIQAIVEGYGTGIAKIGEMMTRPFIPEQYKSVKNEQGQAVNKTPILRRFLGGEKRTQEEQLRTYASMPVEVLYDKLILMKKDEANNISREIKKINPAKFTLLKKHITQRKLGLSNEEIQIGNMGVVNGERAKAVADKVNRLKTREEKNAYIKKLRDAKIVTDQIFQQLKTLKENGYMK